MPLTGGMVASHAPSLFAKTFEGWQRQWQRLTGGTPQPPEVEREDAARVADYVRRSEAAFAALRAYLAAANPDVLVILAGDQNEWFNASHLPNLMLYAGEDEIVGYHNIGADDHDPPLRPWEHPERFEVRLPVAHELAEYLLRELVAAGFDVAISRKQRPQGDPRRGAPHALVRPLPLILPRPDLPVVPLMMKTVERTAATLTGERCLALGRALEQICDRRPERVAVFGSGGMSHDPFGPRAGWVDEPLDRWVIEQLVSGTPDRLRALYSFQSAATTSGTGELRTWIPVAAAMDAHAPGTKATLVDYFAARKSTAGCGWVTWSLA